MLRKIEDAEDRQLQREAIDQIELPGLAYAHDYRTSGLEAT